MQTKILKQTVNFWIALIPWVFAATSVLPGGGATIARYAFLPVAAVSSLLLYRNNKASYVRLVVLLWFFTPEIRRLTDFRLGYQSASLIMLAPYVATLLIVPRVIGVWASNSSNRRLIAFELVSLATLWGAVVGLFTSGVVPVAYDLLNWMLPLFWASFVAVEVKRDESIRVALKDGLRLAVLVSSAYGIYQFFALPEWDLYWVIESEMFYSVSFEDFGKGRIFGTLNSPGPFAFALVVGIFLLFDFRKSKKVLNVSTIGIALVALALSQVRAAWFGLVVGVLYALVTSEIKQIRKILLYGGIAVLVAMPLFTIPVIQDLFLDRFRTLSALESDTSYQTRLEFYETVAPQAFTNLTGVGLGITGLAGKLSDEGEVIHFDSGLMNVPYSLGWPGGLLYLLGVAILLTNTLNFKSERVEDVLPKAAFVSMVAVTIFGNSMIGVSGIFTWTAAALWSQGSSTRLVNMRALPS
jgi:hypothetical protein